MVRVVGKQVAHISIGPDGEVYVKPEDAGTFKDLRLPIHTRMRKLGILIGRDEWSDSDRQEAECLLMEASLRLEPSRDVNEKRHAAYNQMADRLHQAQQEIHRLLRYIEYLKDPSKTPWDDSWMEDYLTEF